MNTFEVMCFFSGIVLAFLVCGYFVVKMLCDRLTQPAPIAYNHKDSPPTRRQPKAVRTELPKENEGFDDMDDEIAKALDMTASDTDGIDIPASQASFNSLLNNVGEEGSLR